MKTGLRKLLVVSSALSFGLMASMASAATISVVNANTTSLSNTVTTSSNTGGNVSTGARGARGGYEKNYYCYLFCISRISFS